MEKIYSLAVIGAGPTGIASAVEGVVSEVGEIALFEKSYNHSTTIDKFYKDNKRVDKDWKGQKVELNGNIEFSDGTKESTLKFFDEVLNKYSNSIDMFFNSEIEKVVKESNIFNIHTSSNIIYKAEKVVVAIGNMGKPNKPSYKIPASLKKVVNFNLDSCSNSENILVVGGGNSASEYAYSLSENNRVTLSYRGDKFIRLNPENLSLIKNAVNSRGLHLKLATDIESISDDNGKVKVFYSYDEIEIYDRVIYAIGGTTPVDFLKKSGFELDESNKPIYDENFMSHIDGLYIAGDIASHSGGSIAMGLNHSYKIIQHIKSYS